jgi:threonine/homoserine efflux transporter RhtA
MVIFQAILELSNGCLALSSLQSETTRFILCAAFLACGGFCVLLQTMSVTAFLGLGLYIPGKIMQTSVSLILATAIAYYLFPSRPISATITIPLVICTAIIISISRIWIKKRYGNSV